MLQTACGSIPRTTPSSVTIGNGGNKPAKAQLTILYNQGSEQYQVEQMLAPDEHMLVDFGKLIRNQIPDKKGHVLPPDLTSLPHLPTANHRRHECLRFYDSAQIGNRAGLHKGKNELAELQRYSVSS